jgi:hypothetical protein
MTGERRQWRKRDEPWKLAEPPSADAAGQGGLTLSSLSLAPSARPLSLLARNRCRNAVESRTDRASRSSRHQHLPVRPQKREKGLGDHRQSLAARGYDIPVTLDRKPLDGELHQSFAAGQ